MLNIRNIILMLALPASQGWSQTAARVTDTQTLPNPPSDLLAKDIESLRDPQSYRVETESEYRDIFFKGTTPDIVLFPNVKIVDMLFLEENVNLGYFDFATLNTIKGNFYIENNPLLYLFGLRELQTMKGNLYVEDNPKVVRAHFPKLETVEGLYISDNKKLESIEFDSLTNAKFMSLGYGIDGVNGPNLKICFRKQIIVEGVQIDLGRKLTKEDERNLEQSFVKGSLERDYKGDIKPLQLRVRNGDDSWKNITPQGDGSCPHL